MKTIFLSFLMAFCTIPSWAEDINALMVHLASGKQVVCMLDEYPVVAFQDDELVLVTQKNVVRYMMSDVLKFTYVNHDVSSIKGVENNQTMFSFTGNTLTMNGLTPKSQVAVYSVDGAQIASVLADKKGNVSLSLPELPGNIYVVKTSVANFKISKP